MKPNPVGPFSALNRTSKNGIAEVNVLSEEGQEAIPVKVSSSFKDAPEPFLADRLTNAVINFVKKPKTKEIRFDLITPDAGGDSIGSIFSAGILESKYSNVKEVLLVLERDSSNRGSNTACFSFIQFPKTSEDMEKFKTTVRKCVSELIDDGAYVLRERANARSRFEAMIIDEK